jgi:rhamnopyranosyl-N-acetylglucosaminyl-diphospho-decaprenol beta-1,3/1,4-galactofuranosyltransferase
MDYAAIIVTRNSTKSIKRLLTAINGQTCPPARIIIVDNASEDGTIEHCRSLGLPNLMIIQNSENLGGAGGFHIGLRKFMDTGLPFAWTFDDDAIPVGDNCSERLLSFMQEHTLKVGGSLVLACEDNKCTAYEYNTAAPTLKVSDLMKEEIIWNDVKFFNGVMLERDVIDTCGLPRPELFIRGDEAEYRRRIKERGFRMATSTEVQVVHPSSAGEYRRFRGRKIWYSPSRGKRYFAYRNKAIYHAERGLKLRIIRELFRHVAFNITVTKDYTAVVDCCRGYIDGALGKTNNGNSQYYKELCGNRRI